MISSGVVKALGIELKKPGGGGLPQSWKTACVSVLTEDRVEGSVDIRLAVSSGETEVILSSLL